MSKCHVERLPWRHGPLAMFECCEALAIQNSAVRGWVEKGWKAWGLHTMCIFECCEVPHPRKDGQETKKLRRCVTLQILLGWHWIKSFIGSFNCATPLQGDPGNRFRRSCALNSEWKTNCELLAADVRCAVQPHLRLKKERHSRHIGTRQYRSPEVVLGLQWDEKTDAPRTFEKGQFLVSGRRR